MKIAVSRQGNLAVINHEKFQIHFNLVKGTWDYIDETGQTIIKNGRTQIALHDGSTVSTEDAGRREFITEPMPSLAEKPSTMNAAASVVSGAGKKRLPHQEPSSERLAPIQKIRFSHEAAEKGIRLNTYLHCFPDAPYIVLKVGIENLEPVPIKLDSVTLLGISSNRGAVQLGGKPSGYHLFTNTPPTFPGGGLRKLYDGFRLSKSETSQPCQGGILHDTDSQRALVFGFLTTEKWWPQVSVGHQVVGKESPGINSWSLSHRCEQQRCSIGEEVLSESVYLNFTGGVTAAYQPYIELVAAQNNAETAEQVVCGWSLLDSVDASEGNALLEQVVLLAENPLFRPQYPGGIEYIQVDATETNVTSPEMHAERLVQLQKTVACIHAKGFKAAIRINPFCATLDSELIQQHPECCFQVVEPNRKGRRSSRRATSGRPGGKKVLLPGSGTPEVALLDVSHPETQAHIRRQIKRIIAEWGCELIQVDFSGYTTVLTSPHHLKWHDNSLTSVQLYRLAVQVLKDAVAAVAPREKAADVLLASHNLVAGPCIGSFALNRPVASSGDYGADTVNWHRQNGTKHRISQAALHHSEHNRLWSHIFGELRVDEPRPVNEAIVEITAAAFSGGAVFCADSLATLKPHRAELLAKLFPLIGTAAKPIKLYDEPFPRIWSLSVGRDTFGDESAHLVAVFNWQDHEDDAEFELDALGLPKSKDYLVHDFWMRQYLGTISESVTLLNIPPRSVKLLCLREAQDVPQLLATDMHWTQGSVEMLSAGWDSRSDSYLFVCKPLRKSEGTCFIHVPEDYLPIGVSTYGSEYRYQWHAPICQVTLAPTEKLVHASVRFARTSG